MTKFKRRNASKKMLLMITAIVLIGVNQSATAHGTITEPASRVYNCYLENPENPQSDACKAAVESSGAQVFYDWNGVRQGNANDNHRTVVSDGELCSGGDPSYFGGLDLARNDWVAVDVTSGDYTFNWSNTAPHATAYVDYYITQESYDINSPLYWDNLEFICRNGATGPETSSSHTCSLPERTGKHIVYSIWQRSDSPEAFYACVDVSYGGSSNENKAPVSNPNGPYSADMNQAIVFSSSGSSDPDGHLVSYQWTFGDGNTSTQENPTHSYSAAGSFTVELTVTDNENKSSSSSTTAEIQEDTIPGNCTEPQYVAGTQYNNGDLVQNVDKKFNCLVGGWCSSAAAWAYEPGVGMHWQLAWADAGDCSGGGTNIEPSASINGPYSSLVNNAINFSSLGSSDSDGTITDYLWDFGDGQTSTEQNPSHVYTSTGSFSVSLKVTDNQGAEDTATTTATITDSTTNQDPIANANGPYQTVLGSSIQFSSNGSNDPDGSITQYLWEFGDGSSSTAAQASHVYSAIGLYNVTLTVTDNSGSSNSSQTTANVTQVPVDSDKIVLGYFVQWGVYQRNYHVNNIKTSGSADKLTHINYAFGNVVGGKCVGGDNYADFEKSYTAAQSVDGVADKWDDPLKGSFNQLKKLKLMYPHIKILWSFGGWTWSGGFAEAAQNPQAFADSCFDLVHDPRWDGLFDGIDIDWEYPNACGLSCDTSGRTAFSTLMSAVRNRFGSELVTAAVPAGESRIDATDYGLAAQYMDWYNVMTYDFFGAWDRTGPTAPHSALYDYAGMPIAGYSSDNALDVYIKQGVPTNKLLLGIGFYGRGWTGVTQDAPGGSATGPATGQYEAGIQDYKVLKNTCPVTGSIAGTSYAKCGTNWWNYDSPSDIAEKMIYVKDNNLGGSFFWELSGDTSDGELIEAMKNNL
jgi:chitinase